MKIEWKLSYECEKCGEKFEDEFEIEKHIGKHYGLNFQSHEEYKEWVKLTLETEQISKAYQVAKKRYSNIDNEICENYFEAYKNVKNKLEAFEKGISVNINSALCIRTIKNPVIQIIGAPENLLSEGVSFNYKYEYDNFAVLDEATGYPKMYLAPDQFFYHCRVINGDEKLDRDTFEIILKTKVFDCMVGDVNSFSILDTLFIIIPVGIKYSIMIAVYEDNSTRVSYPDEQIIYESLEKTLDGINDHITNTKMKKMECINSDERLVCGDYYWLDFSSLLTKYNGDIFIRVYKDKARHDLIGLSPFKSFCVAEDGNCEACDSKCFE